MGYSIGEHINATGAKVTITLAPLYDQNGERVPAIYLPGLHEIRTASGLGPIQRRCVLAHEAIHAEYRDNPTGLTLRRIEHRADRLAASNLIDAGELHELQACYPDSPREWCLALRVTPHILEVYLSAQREGRRVALADR